MKLINLERLTDLQGMACVEAVCCNPLLTAELLISDSPTELRFNSASDSHFPETAEQNGLGSNKTCHLALGTR